MRKLIPLATFFYTGLVVFASLAKFIIPIFKKAGIENGDKYGHAIAYFGFACLWAAYFYIKNGVLEPNKEDFKRAIYKSAIFSVIFGISMEFAQLILTDHRSFDLNDALANSAGVVLASIMMLSLANFFSLIKKSAI